MGKLCKILAVLILVCGIIGSLVLAGTSQMSVTEVEGYFGSYEKEEYNTAYALTGTFSSIIAFALLYGFGMIIDCMQRMDRSLNSLAQSLHKKECEESRIPATNSNSTEKQTDSNNAAPQKYWFCPECGYKNIDAPGNTYCKSCNSPRGK